MSELEFRQPDRRLTMIIGFGYLVVILIVAFAFFGRLAEFVNDLAGGGYLGTGLLVGAVCVIPLIVVMALTRQRVTLRQDAETLTLRIGRREDVIPRRRIQRIVVHEPANGPIRLYADDAALLASLNPPPREYARVVGFLVDAGYSEAGRQPVFGGRMTAVTFTRDTPMR